MLELPGGHVRKHICQGAISQTFWNKPKICMSKVFLGNVTNSGNTPHFAKILQIWRSGMFIWAVYLFVVLLLSFIAAFHLIQVRSTDS